MSTSGGERRPLLPRLRLDDLLAELQARLSEAMAMRDRVQRLLEAVVAIGSDLDLQTVLRRIVEAAVALVDAEYGALGVIGEGDELSQFLTVGVDERTAEQIGSLPRGRGVLGELIRDPRPLRLDRLADHPASYGFPPGHPKMDTFLGVPIRVRSEVFGNLYLTEKRGGGSFDEYDENVLEALAAAAGVAIENARLYQDVQLRQQWVEASSDVVRALLSGTPPQDVLRLVAARALALSGAEVATVLLPAGPGLLAVEVAEGSLTGLEGLTVPVDGSVAGGVYRSGEPRSVRDLAETEAVRVDVPLGPAVLIPLNVRTGDSGGVLSVAGLAGRPPFPAAVVTMLTGFGAQAALALELAERRRAAERVTLLEDRDRIARDLHDLVIQRLFATGMALEGASRLVVVPEAAARVRRAVDDLDATIREIRSTIFALQSQEEGTVSLRARILEAVDAVAPSLGFAPSVQLAGLIDTQIPDAVAEHLLAVLREALSNAARHAKAHRVEVLVEVGDDVCLAISDDGVGIEPGGRRSGLEHMAERARELGGGFDVGANPGGGTRLEWRVPLGESVGPSPAAG